RLHDATIRLFEHGIDHALGPNTAYRLPAVLAAIGEQVAIQAQARTGFHPGRLDVDSAQDGDLGFTGNLGLGLGSKDCYAAVGPFADWLLTVREIDNPGSDWSQCNTIVIDFHGFHQSFAYSVPGKAAGARGRLGSCAVMTAKGAKSVASAIAGTE